MKKINKIFVLFFFLILTPFVYSDACDVTFLNNNIIAFYIWNETTTTYYNAQGNSNFDLDVGNTPDRTIEVWGYGQDHEQTNSDYLKHNGASTDYEITNNYSIAYHYIPENDYGDQQVHFHTLKLSGTYRGVTIQFRTDETYAHFEYYGNANQYYYTKASTSQTLGVHHYVIHEIRTGSNRIFINNSEVGYSSQVGGTAQFWAGLHEYELSDSANNRYFDGVVGNYLILNTTLNSTCRQYIQANTYPYFSDTTPPEITLKYPSNNTRYNNYNGSILFNATDNNALDNCTINNSDWDYKDSDGIDFSFNRSSTPDGNYTITISCEDTSSNIRNSSFNFFIDTVNPTINIFSPINNTFYNSNVLFNVSFYDLYLYQSRIYIPRSDSLIDSIRLTEGTHIEGNLSSLNSFDGVLYNISENGGIVLDINFTDVYNFTGLGIYYNYIGNPAHNMYLRLYNYDTQDWDNYIKLDSGFEGWENYSFTAFGIDGYKYVNNLTNIVLMQINHTSIPINTHWLSIDNIFINGTERYHYYNFSGTLFTDYYNVSEYWDISEENDGQYNITFETSDTHTNTYFNDIIDTETGLTNNYQNYYKKYIMKYGEIEFITPIDLEIIDIYETDRIKQYFHSILDTDLEEIEIEIIADSLEYFEDSEYNCHFILNKKYWYDCEGLENATTIHITDSKAVFKFFHTTENSISESLGGLNYINTSYSITLDRISPTLENYTITNSTTSIQWELYFNENNTYSYRIGLNCSDNSVSSAIGNDTDLTITTNFLTSGTSYYMDINLTDFASNTNNYCINGTTASTGVDYGIIQGIVETAIDSALEDEATKMNQGLIIVIIFIVWAFILSASYLIRAEAGIMFASIWGVFASIWLWSSTDFPKFVVVTFAGVCIWIIYLMWRD